MLSTVPILINQSKREYNGKSSLPLFLTGISLFKLEYNLFVIRKIKNLFNEIKGDFISCKNRAQYLLSFSPIDKRILFAALIIIFLFTVFRSSSESEFYLYFLKILFVSVITFINYVQSDTYWFLRKKVWCFKLISNNKKCILDTIKNIQDQKIEKEKNPIGAIYVTAYSDLEGNKPLITRIQIEIIIVLTILFFTFPAFFVFNVVLFCGMWLHVTFFEHQANQQVWQDILALTNSVKSLYEEDPENCRKFIMENTMLSVRALENIYMTVKNSAEK